ncbi:shikimate kinase AroK [Amphritea sp. 1_MG-2023]|uniref:shikimate kinase AroK n=1 Tax=Amphritea sp. 1_MG-2023 TaxID=3062670 RepID=UPI0026E49561|nr:shikimate kinase AroK [Amphritea sp. 1_MG-2023]MDO6563040.1 shikimate kinase AroK [Amphritea sp. 1_MG-2023]
MNIFLIGPMGAGKSTIGRLLSQELKLSFVDSDKVIEELAGADIPWIFDVEGETGFRDREAKIIDQLSAEDNQVLATGGGAVLRSENRSNLQGRGTVVYLQASVAQQLERTARDKNRPLLQTSDPETVLKTLMEERHPLYLQVADVVVDTERRNPKAVVTDILTELRAQQIIK